MKKYISTQAAVAVALVILGATVMLGWLLRDAAMVQFRPGFVGMVFNTALGFALIGIALFLPLLRVRWTHAVQTAIGWGLIAMAAAILIEYVADINLFIDASSLHFWLDDGNPQPGRMAPNTSVGFLLCGLVLVLVPRVRSKSTGVAVQLATFIVLMLGLIGLSSYFLRLDLLYAWFPAVRMAIHTAAGMTIAGIGLWSGWRHAEWYRTQRYFKDDEKTGYVGATILSIIALTAGVAGFSVQQATLEKTFGQTLLAQVRSQTMLFETVVKAHSEDAETAARRPDLVPLVRLSNSHPQKSGAANQLQIVAQGMLGSGFAGIAIRDKADRDLVRLGRFASKPEIETNLGLSNPVSLFWDGGFYLRSRLPVQDKGALIGSIIIEQPLTLITEQFAKAEGLGATGEMGMCVGRPDSLLCFPQYRNAKVYTSSRLSANGKPTPMSYAVDGQSGFFKGLDYRGHNVIAAYGPLTANGLGLVIKQDTTELFQPIREQLHWYGPLLVLLVAGGAMLLRSQVTPIVSKLLRSEREALESEARSREITETLGEGVVVIDRQARILFTNPAAQQLLGWTEQELLGQHEHRLFHHTRTDGAPYPAASCEISKAVYSGQSFRAHDEAFWRKDGSMLPVSVNAAPIIREGLVVGAVLAFHDIIERRNAAQALAAESAKNAMLLRTASDGIHVLDLQGNVVQVNDAFCRMLGYSSEELQGMNVTQWDVQWSGEELRTRLRQALDRDMLFETKHRHRDGSIVEVEIHAGGVEIDGKRLVYASARDISERKKAAEQMQHLAHFDNMTDLPNRALLTDRLQQALIKAKRNSAHIALMFIDLDKFKPVNDTLGHHVGDLLLKEVATRLQDCLRESDTVARVGGDEFVVLLPRIEVEQDATVVAEKILQALNQPFVLEGHVIHISASIGVASYPEHGADHEQLMNSADRAMYRAKKAGGAATVSFGQLESASP